MQVKIEEGADDEDMDEDDEDAAEEVIVPEGVNVDPAVLSTLPPSMQVWLSRDTRLLTLRSFAPRKRPALHGEMHCVCCSPSVATKDRTHISVRQS